MRGRVTAALIAATAAACLMSAPVYAAPGDSTNTDTDEETGTIIPTVSRTGWSGGSSSGLRCTWTKVPELTGVETDGAAQPGQATGDGVVFQEGPNGREFLYFRSACSNGRPDSYVWVPNVSAADVRNAAFDQLKRQLPDPTTNISPDPAGGGYVNFGLWLAVDDPGPVSATAAVGPVWVTITAAYSTSTWNMGTGNPFDCDGLGTPIVDADTDEEGPCGFTYDKPSAPRFTGAGLAYKASVTGTWTITWVDYTGAAGGLDALQRITPFDYRVREIQTVGVADQ